MGRPLRVLIIAESADDTTRIVWELQQAGYTPTYARVETPAAMTVALDEPWDIVISASRLPQCHVLTAIALVEAHRLGLPFIVVSGSIGVEIAMDARWVGADDSLQDRIARLEIVVARALQGATEQQAHRPVDAARVLLWMAGPDRHCTYVNDAWLEYTGCTLEQELGHGWVDQMHPADAAPWLATYSTAFMARQPFVLEYRLRRADGVYCWMRERGVPVVTPEGLLSGYIGSAVDITGRKNAESLIQQAQTALARHGEAQTAPLYQATVEGRRREREAQRAQHFALLGRLAAGVWHELRNPLSALSLQVELLEEELGHPSPDSQEAIAETLAAMKTNLACLDNLGQTYLSLVRVRTLERAVHDLGEALQEWMAEWHRLLSIGAVTLRTEGIEGLGQVAFHPRTFRHALLNLVHNALEAMPDGGTLTLAGHSTATHVQLQVRDTGSGIPPAHLEQIFEPLYTTKPEGTGLGLAIVQEVMAAHEGQVTVESVPGQGTTFTLVLPRAVQATQAHAP